MTKTLLPLLLLFIFFDCSLCARDHRDRAK